VNFKPLKHAKTPLRRLLEGAALLVLLAATSGCETMFGQSDGFTPTSSHPGADFERKGAGSEDGRRELAAYVNFMNVLGSTDEQGWHTIFEHTLSAYQEEPTKERRLRLALVMSRADRKSHESRVTLDLLGDARNLFAEAVNDPERMPPLVRKFAQLQLDEVESRLALYEEMHSLRSQLAKAHQESQTAQRDRSEVEARMRHIDAALNEANAKLEAVMNIERDIETAGKETFP
jgi:hypothetical protein